MARGNRSGICNRILLPNISGETPLLFRQITEKGMNTREPHPDCRNLDAPVLLMLNKCLHIPSCDFFKTGLAAVTYHAKKCKDGAPATIQCPWLAIATRQMSEIRLNMILSRQIHPRQALQNLAKSL
jgi:hypothetical protein